MVCHRKSAAGGKHGLRTCAACTVTNTCAPTAEGEPVCEGILGHVSRVIPLNDKKKSSGTTVNWQNYSSEVGPADGIAAVIIVIRTRVGQNEIDVRDGQTGPGDYDVCAAMLVHTDSSPTPYWP